MKNVSDFNFLNKTVLLRVDYNVPTDNLKKITDDTRIRYSLPTIKKIISDNGKIILISHFGRPKGIHNKYSLKFLIPILSKILNKNIHFIDDCMKTDIEEKIKNMKCGDIFLLENLRFYKEEEEGNEEFAYKLSKYGNFYINDAFSVSHRYHSSIFILPKFFPKEKKCIGFLMKKEIDKFKKFLSGKMKKPISILLGGSKILSKLEIIDKCIEFSDHILLGGAMAYPFIMKKGGKVGEYEKKFDISKVKNIIKNILYKNYGKNILIYPKDVIIAKFNDLNKINISSIYSVPKKWIGLDIGPKSIKCFSNYIRNSNTILWNGPMGMFENNKFSMGTKIIAEEIIKMTEKGSYSIVGGGDSLSALRLAKKYNKISYLSTGGGAMLESLKNKVLPGIIAINK